MSRRYRQPLRDYRSVDPAAGPWWQRGADRFGLHSFVAFIAGVVLVAVIGVTFDPLGVTTEFDLPEVEQEAFDAGYAAAYADALVVEGERFRRETLIALVLEAPEQDAEWVQGVRQGRAEGWNQALDAMRAASEADAPTDAQLELRLLDDLPRR